MASNENANYYNSLEHIFARIKQHNTKLRLLERHEIKNYLRGIELNTCESLSEQFLAERCRDHLLRILKSYDEFVLSFSGRSFSGHSSATSKVEIKPSVSRPVSSLHNISNIPLDLLTNDNFLTCESMEISAQHGEHLEIQCSNSTEKLENTSLTMDGRLKQANPLESVPKKRINVAIENNVPLIKKKRFSQESFNKENLMKHNLFSTESLKNSTVCKLQEYKGNSKKRKDLKTDRQSTMSPPLRCTKYKRHANKVSIGVNTDVLIFQDQSQESNNDVYSLDVYDQNKNRNSKLVNCTQQIIDDSIVIPEETRQSCENSQAIEASCLLGSCNETIDYGIEDMPIIFADNEIPNIILSQGLLPSYNSQAEPQSENSDSVPEEQPISATGTSLEDQSLQWNFHDVKGDMSEENLSTMLKECVENIKQCHAHLENQFQIAAAEFANKGDSGAALALKKMFSQISRRSGRLDVDAKLELLTELFENQNLNSEDSME